MNKDLDGKQIVVLSGHWKGVIGVLDMVEVVPDPMWVTTEGTAVKNESEHFVLN